MKLRIILLFIGVWFVNSTKAQTIARFASSSVVISPSGAQDEQLRKTKFHYAIQQWIGNHPNYRSGGITTIPIVFHVVWHNSIENISDAQIMSQIDVLNKDFRKLNADTLLPSHPFAPFAGDARIEFCLAQTDPGGSPTNGITRTFTNITAFSTNIDSIKFTSSGGHDAWDPDRYLNIWVGNMPTILADATLPWNLGASPEKDGVRVHYTALGSTGAAAFPFDKGRSVTQCIALWLGVIHIWGDNTCGEDSVADTPPQNTYHFNCPSFPTGANNSCGSGPNGEMYMNFMDFVNDACMSLFTNGQVVRMQAALNTYRSNLLNSQACNITSGISSFNKSDNFTVFPNPAEGTFWITSETIRQARIEIFDGLNRLVYSKEHVLMNGSKAEINLSESRGIYLIRLSDGENSFFKRLSIQ